MVKNISIFCGAHEGTNPNYALEAKKITALLSKKGVDVVFGGGNVGIMKIISDEAKDNNSKVTGITMESLHNLELTNPRIDDLVVTHSLLERKDEFMKRSDAFRERHDRIVSSDEILNQKWLPQIPDFSDFNGWWSEEENQDIEA